MTAVISAPEVVLQLRAKHRRDGLIFCEHRLPSVPCLSISGRGLQGRFSQRRQRQVLSGLRTEKFIDEPRF